MRAKRGDERDFNRDNLGAGMRAAIEEVKHGYHAMIDSWNRQ
jgi:hypothetical protein